MLLHRRLLFPLASLLQVLLTASFRNHTIGGQLHNPGDTGSFPAFTKAKGYEGKNKVAKEGLVSLISGLDNDYYLYDSASRTGFLYIETRVERLATAAVKKIPLNIAIVIDRSGSMAGEKMEFAKKAAMEIVHRLSPNDFISIIIYDEFIDVIQPATPVLNKDSIRYKISKIKPRGSTNLWGGSERGYEQVKANYKLNYINRVLLISDGNITAGVKIPARIITGVQEHKDIDGISISTFGVGLDYNETLMTDMAENGAGNYYFIDQAEKMAGIFSRELDGLYNVVAQDAELRIRLPKGVHVEAVLPLKFAQEKDDVVVKYRDLFAEEVKGLVLEFRLDNNASKELPVQAQLAFTDVANKQRKLLTQDFLLRPTGDADLYQTHFNKAVAEQVVLFTANANLERAMLQADKGNYEAAKRFAEANGYYFENNAGFLKTSAELQKMDSINRFYKNELARARTMSVDSVKLMQKAKRAENYRIRNKKLE